MCRVQGGGWPASTQAPLHSSVHTYNLCVCQIALLQAQQTKGLELWSKRSGSCPEPLSHFSKHDSHCWVIQALEKSFVDWVKSQNVNVWGLLFCDVFCPAVRSCSQVIAKNMGLYAGCCHILCQEWQKIGGGKMGGAGLFHPGGQVRRRKTPPMKKCTTKIQLCGNYLSQFTWRDWSGPPEFCYMCSCMKHCEKQCKKFKCQGFLSVCNL